MGTTTKERPFWIAPAATPEDRYAAGYDANDFETADEAIAAIISLQALGNGWDVGWIVNLDVFDQRGAWACKLPRLAVVPTAVTRLSLEEPNA